MQIGSNGKRDVCIKYLKVAFAHTGPKSAIFTRLRCKQWSCPACAKTNTWVWRNWLLKRLPEVSQEWWLLTLTASSLDRTPWGSMDNIRSNIDRFMKRVKRVFGEIEYVRVYEKHPSSEAIHAHFIVTGFTKFVAIGCSAKLQPMAIGTTTRRGRDGVWAVRTWIKKTAQACSMGYIADCKVISGEPGRAVWYVTKYLTKGQAELHVKGLRHVQVTSGIGSPKQENELEDEWNVAAYITSNMFAPNAKIRDLNTGETIDNDHWENHSFYPID